MRGSENSPSSTTQQIYRPRFQTTHNPLQLFVRDMAVVRTQDRNISFIGLLESTREKEDVESGWIPLQEDLSKSIARPRY